MISEANDLMSGCCSAYRWSVALSVGTGTLVPLPYDPVTSLPCPAVMSAYQIALNRWSRPLAATGVTTSRRLYGVSRLGTRPGSISGFFERAVAPDVFVQRLRVVDMFETLTNSVVAETLTYRLRSMPTIDELGASGTQFVLV